MSVHAATWAGTCTGCHRDGLTVGSRLSHGLRVLCGPCAAKPYTMPSINGTAAAPAAGAGKRPPSQKPDRYHGRRVDVAALPFATTGA